MTIKTNIGNYYREHRKTATKLQIFPKQISKFVHWKVKNNFHFESFNFNTWNYHKH